MGGVRCAGGPWSYYGLGALLLPPGLIRSPALELLPKETGRGGIQAEVSYTLLWPVVRGVGLPVGGAEAGM